VNTAQTLRLDFPAVKFWTNGRCIQANGASTKPFSNCFIFYAVTRDTVVFRVLFVGSPDVILLDPQGNLEQFFLSITGCTFFLHDSVTFLGDACPSLSFDFPSDVSLIID
jgi:hypothetical protein